DPPADVGWGLAPQALSAGEAAMLSGMSAHGPGRSVDPGAPWTRARAGRERPVNPGPAWIRASRGSEFPVDPSSPGMRLASRSESLRASDPFEADLLRVLRSLEPSG